MLHFACEPARREELMVRQVFNFVSFLKKTATQRGQIRSFSFRHSVHVICSEQAQLQIPTS